MVSQQQPLFLCHHTDTLNTTAETRVATPATTKSSIEQQLNKQMDHMWEPGTNPSGIPCINECGIPWDPISKERGIPWVPNFEARGIPSKSKACDVW